MADSSIWREASRGAQPQPLFLKLHVSPTAPYPGATCPLYEHEASKARHSKLLALVFQSLEQLRAAHMALEAEYVQACGEEHLDPQLDASQGSPRTLNLCRYVLDRQAQEGRTARPGPWFCPSPGRRHFTPFIVSQGHRNPCPSEQQV